MGLPGSGKTYLSQKLHPLLDEAWYNADRVRSMANDWDFSEEGRVRQANRMRDLAKKLRNEGNYVVADFVCPTKEARKLFGADYTIWMDTIEKGRFDDTNHMFVKPENFNFKINTFDAKNWAQKIYEEIIK